MHILRCDSNRQTSLNGVLVAAGNGHVLIMSAVMIAPASMKAVAKLCLGACAPQII